MRWSRVVAVLCLVNDSFCLSNHGILLGEINPVLEMQPLLGSCCQRSRTQQ